jgi:ParB-like chromosome segregation protein Spo0J
VRALTIKYEDPRKLAPRANNPRTHTPRQIKQIAASIREFGFINPVLIDGAHGIVAGPRPSCCGRLHRHDGRPHR